MSQYNINNYTDMELLDLIELEPTDNQLKNLHNLNVIIHKKRQEARETQDEMMILFFENILNRLTLYFENLKEVKAMEGQVTDKIMVIDSRYRDNYYETSSTNFSLSNLGQSLKNVVELKLSEIEFPNTWYPFSTDLGNVSFQFIYKADLEAGNEYTTITITSGVYHYSDLIDAINLALANAGITTVTCKINVTLNPTHGSISGQGSVTFASDEGGDQFNLRFFGIDESISSDRNLFLAQKKLGWSLGFRNITPDYYSTLSTSYTSEGLMDTVVLRYFYVVINEQISSGVNSHITPICSNMNIVKYANIIARLSSNGAPFSVNNSNGLSLYSDTRKYHGPIDISKLDIKIINEFGDVININNMDLSLTLQYKVK
jgi:hypothetical protein